MIDGTTVQRDIMKFQNKYCPTDKPGPVGSGYWKEFRKRNRHLVVSKLGKKYELNRSAWSTYAKFAHMYDQVIEEIENAILVELLETPKWMDKDGKEVKEDDEDSVVVMEELTNEAEAVTGILDLAAATDIVQILCTYFTLLHIKLYNF